MTRDDFDFESLARWRGRAVATTVAELGRRAHVQLVLENQPDLQLRHGHVVANGLIAGHPLMAIHDLAEHDLLVVGDLPHHLVSHHDVTVAAVLDSFSHQHARIYLDAKGIDLPESWDLEQLVAWHEMAHSAGDDES